MAQDPRINRLKYRNPYLSLEERLKIAEQEAAVKALEEQIMMEENMKRGSGKKIGTIVIDGEVVPYIQMGPAKIEPEDPKVLERERLRNLLR